METAVSLFVILAGLAVMGYIVFGWPYDPPDGGE